MRESAAAAASSISYEAELRCSKVDDALSHLGGTPGILDGITGADETTHYRNKAQYPVGQDAHGTYTGFYRPHSHDIVKTDRCLIQSERADRLAAAVCAWMDAHNVTAYDEKTGTHRHIYVNGRGQRNSSVSDCHAQQAACGRRFDRTSDQG
ncbi:MAG: hypothetical protein ACLUB2_08000 [Butyricicoccus pullicaecorum]